MSKNMTRKGLALGAAAALVVTGFSAMPANAAGLADTSFVSLDPTTGTEYAVLASNTATFSLTANEADTVSTGFLKHLVTDVSGAIEPTIATTGRELEIADDLTIAVTFGTKLVRVTATHDLQIGDKFYWTTDFDGAENDAGLNPEVIAAEDVIFEVTNINGTTWFEFTSTTALANNDSIKTHLATTMQVIREARHATNGTYVVNSGITTSAADETLVLKSATAETQAVTVQSWMDANANDLIDSTEYASPVRTVTFVKASSLVTGVSMSPITGDSELNAVVSTTPVLNGEQQNAQDATWLNVAFTRQNSTAVEYSQDEETGASTSVWDDTAKTFTVDVDMDADASNTSSLVAGAGGDTADGWSELAAPTAIGALATTAIVVASNVATATVDVAHGLLVGDKVTFENEAGTNVLIKNIQFTVVSVPTTLTFTFALTTADGTLAGTGADGEYNVTTYANNISLADRVFAGTYTAQVYVKAVATGSLLSVGTIAAATASATLATTGTATVTGNTVSTDTANDQTIKVGEATVALTLTALDSLGVALGAGRAVVVTTETPADGGATLGTFKVNGAASATLMTDANGQVTFNVTTNNTTAAAQTRVSALVENIVTVGMDLHWDAQAYTLVDYGTTNGVIAADAAIARTILSGGSYSLNLGVQDQWFQAAATDAYRVTVSGSGVTEGIQSLVAGKAVVAVRDAGLTAVGGNFTSTVVLQKLTGGVWGATSTHTVTTTLKTAPTVNIGADGSTTYALAGVSDLSDGVAAKALVEIDQRSSTTATPAYAKEVLVQGSLVDAVTGASSVNAYLTISGPSNILFSNDKVAARGSLTMLSGTDGKFNVTLYSTTAQTDTVITVTSMGVSKTVKVSFTGTGIGEGTSLVVTTPAAVKPASTFQVKAMLTDAYGNPVDTAADRVKVTYTGAGIVFGTLPTQTDSTGALTFAVLLGSNDTGTITVTVSYDQNGDADYVDAKDLTTTSTTEITASGVVASAEKVNVGSFKGYVALYAKGYAGQKMSAIVAGKWIVVASLASDFERVVRYTGAGYDIVTTIYIDGVKVQTFNVTTK